MLLLHYPQGQWLPVEIVFKNDEVTLIKRTTGRNQKYRILKNKDEHEFREVKE